MTLSLRHFLWATLFGFLVSFQAFSSDDGDVDLEAPPPVNWLPSHQVELDNLYSDYRRAMSWSRFFDVSADILKITGRFVTLGGGITTFISGYYENFVLTMIAGSVTMGGSGIYELGEKADSGGIRKQKEARDLMERIRVLEAGRRGVPIEHVDLGEDEDD
jgi:hypothetical protein